MEKCDNGHLTANILHLQQCHGPMARKSMMLVSTLNLLWQTASYVSHNDPGIKPQGIAETSLLSYRGSKSALWNLIINTKNRRILPRLIKLALRIFSNDIPFFFFASCYCKLHNYINVCFHLVSEVESLTTKASANLKFRLLLIVLLLPTPPSPFLIIAVNSP